MTAVPSDGSRVASPAAPSQTQALAELFGAGSPSAHHGVMWSEQAIASKPAFSAATACSSSSSGPKRSWPRLMPMTGKSVSALFFQWLVAAVSSCHRRLLVSPALSRPVYPSAAAGKRRQMRV